MFSNLFPSNGIRFRNEGKYEKRTKKNVMHMDVEICFWGDGISINFEAISAETLLCLLTDDREIDCVMFAGWRQKQKEKIDIIHKVALHSNIFVEEKFVVCLTGRRLRRFQKTKKITWITFRRCCWNLTLVDPSIFKLGIFKLLGG